MGRGKPKYDDEIIALRKQGLTLRETADAVGVTTWQVAYCMKRHGLAGSFRGKNKATREHVRKVPKEARPTHYRKPFSLIEQGNSEFIKVMPTSRPQYDRLLALLKRAGGEVI